MEASSSYSKGDRIELIHTDDGYTTLKKGDKGTVSFIDSTGTLFIDWDNGSTLGLLPGVDKFRRVNS